MNGHIDLWIDSYLDGELQNGRKKQVEAHLAQCAQCRDLLSQRRSLSALLNEVPAASGLKPTEQFAAEVALQLPRQAAQVQRLNLGTLAWYLAPLALLLAWVFLGTTVFLGGVVAFFPGAESLLDQETATVHIPFLASILNNHGWNSFLAWLEPYSLLDFSWLGGQIGMALIGLLYVCWMALWWARSNHTTNVE
jgi:anti-sigma factor RsiW